MRQFFAMVILCLDGHYREHLRSEQDKERRKSERQAARQKTNDKQRLGRRR